MFRRLAALIAPWVAVAACSGSGSTPTTLEVAAARSNLLVDGAAVTLAASNLEPASGDSVALRATGPVIVERSQVNQRLEATWDPRFSLVGPPTVPESWTLSYFSGAMQLGAAPTTPSGWASVTRISTQGSYVADGALEGSQYLVGSSNGAPPTAASSLSGGAAGEGWNVFFSPDRSRVYNAHPHDGPATIMCRNTADGTPCSAGWPYAVYHTSHRSTGWVDPQTLRLWHETSNNEGAGGWQCINTSGATPFDCATAFVAAFAEASDYDDHIDLQNVGRELYSMDTRHGALTCLDLDANNGAGAPCLGQPYAGFGGTDIKTSGIRAIRGKIYVLADSQIKCFDPQTKVACADMSWPQPGATQPIMPVPSTDGVVRNLCTHSTCYYLDGTTHTLPSAVPAYIASRRPMSCCDEAYTGTETSGTKLFFPVRDDNAPNQQTRLDCFDVATRLTCPGFPIVLTKAYSAVIDPLNANCLWTNGADGVIRTWDVATGTSGCSTPPPVATFKAGLAVPRLACSGATTISQWDTFTLTHPMRESFSAASLTVKDSQGIAVPGWVDVALAGNEPLDIRALTVQQTGQSASFEVRYENLTDTSTANARFRVVGQSPELCWSTTATAACPSGGGLLPAQLPATSSASVTASGSIKLSGQAESPLTPTTVAINAPNVSDPLVCGARLSGALLGPNSVPVEGATVELLDVEREPILDGGAPIAATSDNSGAYIFPPLLVGSYRVRVRTVRDHWTVNTVTVQAGGTGTASGGSGSVTSHVITLTSDLDGQANAAFIGPIDEDGDGVPNYVEKGQDLDNPLDTDGDDIADYLDLDSDNDGILDRTERASSSLTARDTDQDETPDYLDRDSDGDEIPDAYEAAPGRTLNEDGSLTGPVSANGIPVSVQTASGSDVLNYTLHDQNQDGTPDYLSADSDGDRLSDLVERGSTGLPIDSDGDETPDYRDLDSDADGISDAIESNNNGSTVDTDQDGTPDRLDQDSDNDGIRDKVEGLDDPDEDELANYRDLDSDGDNIPDAREGATDPDRDGKPSFLDLDSDNDTIPDTIEQGNREALVDTDDDELPDYLDDDSDGDSIVDSVEAGPNAGLPRNSDSSLPGGDALPDYIDSDSDADGVPDAVEKGDTDEDGVPDYRDTDSDNDGVSDKIEAGAEPAAPRDTDRDSIPDHLDLDSDDDGILDALERGGQATPVDTDDDGTPDMRDSDSDADGIADSLEGSADPDRDNIGNWRDPDSDGDLIADARETDSDDDGDRVPNYLDGDSDDDGVRDALEAGADPSLPQDTDSDDRSDYLDTDSDNDCLPDRLESSGGLLSSTIPSATASDNCTEPGTDRCDTTRGLCTRGCAIDSDCGDASSGAICDENTRGCAPGCRSGSNQCADAAVCSSKNGVAGECLVDTDGDGIADKVEEQRGLNPSSKDSDNDGIPDSVEAHGGELVDTDRDGIADALDTDADGDGIADRLESGADPQYPRDTDRDGVPDYLDSDSDGDGWPDSIEKAGDTDSDGIPDYIDTDSDGDGVRDADELAWDSNRTKTDSDGDGISDGEESGPGPGALDSDGDGRPDAIDMDSDNDSLPDSLERGDGEAAADLDEDDIPDYRDLDTDNDGILDADEARDNRDQYADSDGDGIYDYRDTDSDDDGLRDEAEGSTDTDGDGIGDWRDLDSDNDCLLDRAESAAQTQTDASQPSQLASENCPAEAPICAPQTGACIRAERSLPRDCTQDNAASVCVSGQCDTVSNKCVLIGCTSDEACSLGMYCDSVTMTCVTQLGPGDELSTNELQGESCTPEIAAKVCESGACNRFTNRCAHRVGDSCKQGSECASNACLEGVCVSEKEAPTVARLAGGCTALSGASADNPWMLLAALGGFGLWLRRTHRRASSSGHNPMKGPK